MRILLELKAESLHPQVIPVNYQYPFSAWIYKVISKGDHAFADFLHSKGFGQGNKTYKFFTFSWLHFPRRGFKVRGDRIELLHNSMALEVSFLAPEAIQHFITGLFREQAFELGDKTSRVAFRVANVQVLAPPFLKNTMHYKTDSPVLVSKPENLRAKYLKPDEKDFGAYLIRNLTGKYEAAKLYGLIEDEGQIAPENMHFALHQTEIRSKVITVKAGTPAQTSLKAYHFGFSLSAPKVIHQIGYLSGFGEKNSLGLGYVNHMEE